MKIGTRSIHSAHKTAWPEAALCAHDGALGSSSEQPHSGPYIIAEIGVNHDGSAARARQLTELALDAGADAVKFQFFKAEMLMSRDAQLASYQSASGEQCPLAMLRRLELSLADMQPCIELAHRRGKHAIVTIFSLPLVSSALQLPFDALKTASPDIVHRPLLERLARSGLPMIVSTGAAHKSEVARALSWLDFAAPGIRARLALLQCVSTYPCPLHLASIAAMDDLATLHPLIGYSDHTASITTGQLAASAGACILEKHFTDDCARPGPDHSASLSPAALADYIRAARKPLAHYPEAEACLGPPTKLVLDVEQDVRRVSRQSIVIVRDLPAGHIITPADITFKRPGTGLAPHRQSVVLGRTLMQGIAADCVLTEAHIGPLHASTIAAQIA